jgi:glycosyltransferase involved in cell wall biosynthesis
MNFSVLISVYDKENPDYLKAALESIWNNQTLRPSEIVLVKDGTLTPELDEVIAQFNLIVPLNICTLDHNVGLGLALAKGLSCCSFEMVARMDSDDISCPDRFEKQISLMTKYPELDIAGTNIAEFHNQIDKVCSHRRLPTQFSEIKSFAKKRNPLNHMTVLFKKSAVIGAGNYQPFFGYEDYYLWIRMLLNGSVIGNIPEDLVLARVGNNMFERRHGLRFFRQELRLQKELMQMNFLSQWEYVRNIFFRAFPRLFPVWGLKLVYKFLHK